MITNKGTDVQNWLNTPGPSRQDNYILESVIIEFYTLLLLRYKMLCFIYTIT